MHISNIQQKIKDIKHKHCDNFYLQIYSQNLPTKGTTRFIHRTILQCGLHTTNTTEMGNKRTSERSESMKTFFVGQDEHLWTFIHLQTILWQRNHIWTFHTLPVFLDDFRLLEYELPFLVLLRLLISSFVFPTQHLTTITAVHISNCVETSHQLPVLFGTHNNVHCVGEQKGSTISSL